MKKDDKKITILFFIFLGLWIIFLFFSPLIAENILVEYTKKVSYIDGTIGTSTCYVTETGKCYHEEDCKYIKSKIKTTIYDAKQDGYYECSHCSPDLSAELELTKYKDITYTAPATKGNVATIGTIVLILSWILTSNIFTKILENKKKKGL